MSYWWTQRIFKGVALLLVLLGSISASRPHQAPPRVVPSSEHTQPAAQPTPGINNTSSPNQLFLPLTTNLGFRPPIEFKTVQTGDGSGNAKFVFLPGEPIEYRLEIANNTNTTKSVTVRWVEVNSCGETEIVNETVKIQPGTWEKILTGTTPDCQGVAQNAIEAVNGKETLTYSFDHIVTTPFQGFDKCTLPSISQMQTWWNSSPYWTFNIYIGGVSLACRNSGLTLDWLSSVSQQGWTFIPTWVGLQAPCTGFNHRMSADPTTARQQGRNEADAAVAATSRLSLLGNRVIYYDLEGYSSKATDDCRKAVAAFMQGWVERLHELGFAAGVYGGACSSFAADWAENASPPDNVWLAHWFRPSYYKYASVWNAPCVSNELWANHQRLKQYAGDHNETWGGVTFRIDSSVLDGTVASFQETQRTQQLRLEAVADKTESRKSPESINVDAMQLLSPGKGWVLAGGHLYSTNNDGIAWREITPHSLLSGEVLGVYFLDADLGWLVGFTQGPSGQGEITLLGTTDGGSNWAQIASLLSSEESQLIADAYPYFLDAQAGWIAFKMQSSINFSLGRLFATQDGGRTWEELPLPLGEPVRFLDSEHGWVAGGPRGDQLFRTEDGGRSWQPQELPGYPSEPTDQTYVGLPEFSDSHHGFLPVTISAAAHSRLLVYTTSDGGETWELAQTIGLESQPGQAALFSPGSDGRWWTADPGKPILMTNNRGGAVEVLTPIDITGNLIALDFTSSSDGWAISQEGSCEGDKPRPGERLPAKDRPLICQLTTSLWTTGDAGRTWRAITPLP